MNTEARFLLAIGLMLVVLVGTNILFPPTPPEEVPVDSIPGAPAVTVDSGGDPVLPPGLRAEPAPDTAAAAVEPAVVAEREVVVEGPLYRFTFSNVGARLLGAEMLRFQSLNRVGVVDLLPEGAQGYLGHKLLVGRDTVDLERAAFDVEPSDGLRLGPGSGPGTLRFRYSHPTLPFNFEVAYTFAPEAYQIHVEGRVEGVDRPLLITDLGEGLAYSEADSAGEARSMAYVGNHVQNGIRSQLLSRAEPGVEDGPLLWAALRSKFFVLALLGGTDADISESDYLGGLIIRESALDERVRVLATQSVGAGGEFGYRLFVGPQDYARLSSLGEDLEEVNPYGWRFVRPIVRPFVSIITTILTYLHNQLSLAYGWVLVVFGVLMRVVLWPLNQKAMRAQLKNMAVQPLVQEIQAKHKDNPERLQKEMMKLYKEHGFNPLAGCLPMLLPWPVLIALFFVFQNTIEFRGVPFLWLPDLSAPDPIYVLPLFLGLSMFLMQWVSMRSIEQPNPQMKMMMWIMPVFMVFIFFRLASGLNLYYATANIATIPQQIWINNERKKVRAAGPPKAPGKVSSKKG
ncbi:MAG TPA: membrane protein insertase YidC [Longimicrobiales bacterium]|nr:membrane protein insertase YidC [Longimicrobiales bacterium]